MLGQVLDPLSFSLPRSLGTTADPAPRSGNLMIWGLLGWFFALPSCILNFAWKKHQKNTKIDDLGFPKPSPNPSKIDPKSSLEKTLDFSSVLVRFFLVFRSSISWKCAFYHSKTTNPEVFAKDVLFRFSSIFLPKNLPKTPPKRGPNPSKIDAENVLFFNIVFLGFRLRFGSLLGLQDGAKLAKNRKIHNPYPPPWAILS